MRLAENTRASREQAVKEWRISGPTVALGNYGPVAGSLPSKVFLFNSKWSIAFFDVISPLGGKSDEVVPRLEISKDDCGPANYLRCGEQSSI